MTRKIALAGGGTGGHVYPALSIGDDLKKLGFEVLYYGDPQRLEGRVVEKRGYILRPVKAQAYPRKGLKGKISFSASLATAIIKMMVQLKKDKIELVLGVGGYISAPTILAASALGIPTAVHEANVTPGLANKLCARAADLVLLTYPQTKLPGKARREVVGCPVNPLILSGNSDKALERYGLKNNLPILLIVGGSLGAKKLNELGVELANDKERSYQIIHITGPAYYKEVQSELGSPKNVAIVEYEHQMADAYAAADLVICRSGSSTLAELTLLGKPSLLIPSPNVTDNHQEANARGLEEVGAALVQTETDLDIKKMTNFIQNLMLDKNRLVAIGNAAKALGKPDTAEKTAQLILELLK